VSGLFITLEGPDGSGKTTQGRLLQETLEGKGYAVVWTREPGGPEPSERIRALLADPTLALQAQTEVWLLEAARHEHVVQLIRPALAAGKIVLCDRFADSTLAYQGYGKGLPLAWLRAENEAATEGLRPALTLLFDLDPLQGLQRIAARQGLQVTVGREGQLLWSEPEGMPSPAVERLERESLAFHRRVREGFLALQREEPERIRVFDATQDVETLRREVWGVVQEHLRS